MFYTDDPVRDAEMYDRYMEREMEHSKVGVCDHCCEAIYGCDKYYDIEGYLLHDDCLIEWAAQFKKGA